MKITGSICPMTKDGFHKLKMIYDNSGFACWQCSKTWEWQNKELIATWDQRPWATMPTEHNTNANASR